MMELYLSASEEEDSASEADPVTGVTDDRKHAEEEIRPLLRSSQVIRDSSSNQDSPPRPKDMRTSEAEVYDSLANQVIRSQGLAFQLDQCVEATQKAFHYPPTRRKRPP